MRSSGSNVQIVRIIEVGLSFILFPFFLISIFFLFSISRSRVMLGTVYTGRWKSVGLTQRCAECVNSVFDNTNLWNDFRFSLYAAPSVCHIVATSDEWMKFEIGVSTNGCVAVEHWRLSSIRVYLHQLSD